MGFRNGYFKSETDAPPPLRAVARRRVRFEEVDSLGMVWHGRYVSYLEDGRYALGERFGLSYTMFKKHGIAAPVVQMQIDYRAPLRYDDSFTIEAVLHWCDALRLNCEYFIEKNAGVRSELVATAATVQLITDSSGELLLCETDFLTHFRKQWQSGALHE